MLNVKLKINTKRELKGKKHERRVKSMAFDEEPTNQNSTHTEMHEEIHELHVEKNKQGLGLSIAGGRGSPSFRNNEEGIFISRIADKGPADRAGIKCGDKILEIDRNSVVDVTHMEAVEILKATGPVVVFLISRQITRLKSNDGTLVPKYTEPSPMMRRYFSTNTINRRPYDDVPFINKYRYQDDAHFVTDYDPYEEHNYNNYYMTLPRKQGLLQNLGQRVIVETSLTKNENGFGFRVSGGIGSSPIYISRITEGGVAHVDGKLKFRDRIIYINGIDVTAMAHEQVVTILKNFDTINIVAERRILPFDDDMDFVSLNSKRNFLLENHSDDESNPAFSKSLQEERPNMKGSTQRQISNEEFQSMIPKSPHGDQGESGERGVTVIVKQPGKSSPTPSIKPGIVTDTLKKSNYSETVFTRVTHNRLVEDVVLRKQNGLTLGFKIIGGSDQTCIPFGDSANGIYVAHVEQVGAAANSRKIKMGDRIIKVNGTDVTDATHQEVVEELLRPQQEVIITVEHCAPPEGFQEVIITKKGNEKFGMYIKGGIMGQNGNPYDENDHGIFISKINPNGAIARDNRLRVGMRLLEVDHHSLILVTSAEATAALRSSSNVMRLVVCKGYDPNTKPNTLPKENSTTNKVMDVIRAAEGLMDKPTSPEPKKTTSTVLVMKKRTPSSSTLPETTLKAENNMQYYNTLPRRKKPLNSPTNKVRFENEQIADNDVFLTNDVQVSQNEKPSNDDAKRSSENLERIKIVDKSTTQKVDENHEPSVQVKEVLENRDRVKIKDNSNVDDNLNEGNSYIIKETIIQKQETKPRSSQHDDDQNNERISDNSQNETHFSINDRKNFFENVHTIKPLPRSNKKFSYLNEHELNQLREETKRKMSRSRVHDVIDEKEDEYE